MRGSGAGGKELRASRLRRFRSAAAGCVLALGAHSLAAQASGDVSVRVFSSHRVDGVTLTPVGIGASVLRCPACAAVPMRGAMQVSAGPSGLLICGAFGGSLGKPSEGKGKQGTPLLIAGELRVEAAGIAPASVAGQWRVDIERGAARDRGSLHIAVSVPRERYVMAVLQGEAAPDDLPAALEALAVTVRSYVLARGVADKATPQELTDSTRSEVARFGPVPQRVRDAVQATAGETLWAGGKRVEAYFSENCGGQTEAADAVWGGARKPWLTAHPDSWCGRTDAQWHADASADELRAALAAEGWALPGPVTGVRVLAKTPSGRVARVEVASGTERLPLAAATFRFAIDRALGWNRLRSDWYAVRFDRGRAVFEGRGFGHGVGLCQAGARAFALDAQERKADADDTARAILQFYFPGTEVRVEAGDHGWRRSEGAGWTLDAVAPDAAVLRAGNAAWADARRRFRTAAVPHPVARLYPETDLFRQMTSEPGWTLGTTRGPLVSLQPVSVIWRQGGAEALLLHEFLHVLVEAEAGAAAPLWLREGLVEWLAGLPGSFPRSRGNTFGLTGAMMPNDVLDARLRRPATFDEANEAHRIAQAHVARAVAEYGTDAVRSWLRNGVPASVLPR